MKTVAVALACACSAFAFVSPAVADETVAAATSGDPELLTIRGAKTFPAHEIKTILFQDLDIVLAVADYPNSIDYLRVLCRKTVLGYQSHGFPDVSARVEVGTEAALGLTLIVDEGTRFLAGPIEVRGATILDAAWLIDQLTPEPETTGGGKRTKAKEGICWPIGKPAWFDHESLTRLRERVEQLLGHKGILQARFTLTAIPDRERGVAPLVIDISDEGVPATIDEIEITGNEKNSRDDLLALLEVKPGMVLTLELQSSIEKRLSESGRFVKSSVKVIKPQNAGEPLKLQIKLTEYVDATPLPQALSRTEAALVKFSQWAQNFTESGDELLVVASDGTTICEAVIAPRLGVLAAVRGVPDVAGAAGASQAPYQLAIAMTETEMACYSGVRRRKIASVPPPAPLIGSITFSFNCGPGESSGKSEVFFGMGLSSAVKRGRKPRFDFKFKQSAVGAVELAHLPNVDCKWLDDVLVVSRKEERWQLRIDGQTGRLLEYVAAETDDEKWMTRMTCLRNHFERKLHEIDAAAAGFPNDSVFDRPLTCIIDFACDEVIAWYAADPKSRESGHYASAIRRVVDGGLLAPLDRVLADAIRHSFDEHQFWIPVRADLHLDADDWHCFVRALCESLGMRTVDPLFASGTWPADLLREMLLFGTGRWDSNRIKTEFRFGRNKPGPIHSLAASWLLDLAGSEAAATMARTGLGRLSLDDFRRDYRGLLDSRGLIGECIRELTKILRNANDDDVAALGGVLLAAELLDEAAMPVINELAAQLRERPEGPVAESLAPALDQCWEVTLKKQTEAALRAWVPVEHPENLEYGGGPSLSVYYAPGHQRLTDPVGHDHAADTRNVFQADVSPRGSSTEERAWPDDPIASKFAPWVKPRLSGKALRAGNAPSPPKPKAAKGGAKSASKPMPRTGRRRGIGRRWR